MKKLLFIIPLLIWVSCEDESKDESSSLIGLWAESIWYDDDGIEEVDSDEIESWFDISSESYSEISRAEYVGFTNWAVGEPNNFNDGEDCAEMWFGGEWNDIDCDEERPFIMEIDSLLDDPVLESHFVSVDSLGGSYYYLSKADSLTWHDADDMSESAGGHLVSINSQTENDFISILIQEYDVEVWIGFYKWEGNWEWTTGETCYIVRTIVNGVFNGSPASFDFLEDDSATLVFEDGYGDIVSFVSFKAYDDSAYVYVASADNPPTLVVKFIRTESYNFTPVCE